MTPQRFLFEVRRYYPKAYLGARRSPLSGYPMVKVGLYTWIERSPLKGFKMIHKDGYDYTVKYFESLDMLKKR